MPTTLEHADNRELAYALAYLNALDSTVDSTAALQAALDSGTQIVTVPPGTYQVEGTLVVPAGCTLSLVGVTLERLAAATSTEPVVHVKGSKAKLLDGIVRTEKAHPNGIIIVGHRDLTSAWNSDNCAVHDTQVRGVQAAGNIGIKLMSSQPALGDNYSSYFHRLINVMIRGCDIGILFSEKSNGCTVVAPHFWDCITAAICFQGAYANDVIGGFVHTCTNGVIGVQFVNHGAQTYSTHHADSNTVIGFNVEPSGAASKGVSIASDCKNNFIDVMGNVAGGNVVLNANNTILSRFGKHQFPANRVVEVTALSHLGSETGLTHIANQAKGTCGENITVDIADITLGTRKSVLVDIELVCTNATLDNPTVLRHQYAVKNIGGVFAFTMLDGQMNGNALTITWSTPVAGVARLAITTFNNGTATTYTYGWSMRVRGSTLPTVTWF